MFVIETDIDRDPETVFGHLAAVEATPSWYSAVQSAAPLTSGPVGVGSRYRFERQSPSGPAVNDLQFTVFQPPSLFTIASRSGPAPFIYRYVLRPAADGGTHLTLEGEISGKGLTGAAALLAPLAPALFERGMRENIAVLKRLIEAR